MSSAGEGLEAEEPLPEVLEQEGHPRFAEKVEGWDDDYWIDQPEDNYRVKEGSTIIASFPDWETFEKDLPDEEVLEENGLKRAGRFGELALEEGYFVVYDRDDPETYIQSDTVMEVER